MNSTLAMALSEIWRLAEFVGCLLLLAFVCYSMLRHFLGAVGLMPPVKTAPVKPGPLPLEESERGVVRRLAIWAGIAMLIPAVVIYCAAASLRAAGILVVGFTVLSSIAFFGAICLAFAKRKSEMERRGRDANLLLALLYLVPAAFMYMMRPHEYVSANADWGEINRQVRSSFQFDPPAEMRVKHFVQTAGRDPSYWMEAEVPNLSVSEFAKYLTPIEGGKWLPPGIELPRRREDMEWWPDVEAFRKMHVFLKPDQNHPGLEHFTLYFDVENGRIYGLRTTW